MKYATIIDELNNNHTGLCSLIYPRGSSVDLNELLKNVPGNVHAIILDLDNEIDFKSKLSIELKHARDQNCNYLWVYIRNFDNFSTEKKCKIVKQSRSVKEEGTGKIGCKFIFCGSWSYYAFVQEYEKKYGKTASPPLHTKDIILISATTTNDIAERYRSDLNLYHNPSKFGKTCLSFFAEQTGGDDFLISQAIAILKRAGNDWKDNIEDVLKDLASTEEVVNEIDNRLKLLDKISEKKLIALLLFHRVDYKREDIAAEQLIVTGIAKSIENEYGDRHLKIASPIVENIIRRIFNLKYPDIIAPPDEICFYRSSSLVAFRFVAEIENLLRNIIVTSLYKMKKNGSEWHEHLKRIKTKSHTEYDAEEIITHISQILADEFGLLRAQTITTDSESAPDVRQITIYDSAIEWQKRTSRDPAVKHENTPLLQFTTTEEICSILLYKNCNLVGDGKLFPKDFLSNCLRKYTSIRSAIAHNRSVTFKTIKSLQIVLNELVGYLTTYSNNNQFLPPPEEQIPSTENQNACPESR